MIKTALIGAGKMGISHLAVLGAHPDVLVTGVTDTSKLVTDVLRKHTSFECFDDHRKMIAAEKPDAVFVAVPTRFHAAIVKELLQQHIHVFVEKPFCLTPQESVELVALARENNVVNQVGYHNKFIGTFREAKRLIKSPAFGAVKHFTADMNGPVVLKTKQETWRSKPEEGGGCLMDYAAHIIDLIHYLIAPINNIKGALLPSFFSPSVEDGVFCLLETDNGSSGVLNVNWSDETFRKMSTVITVIGAKGKIVVDTTELKIYFKQDPSLFGYTKGWNIRHINSLASPVEFYLRGEEYSAQIDHFINAIKGTVKNTVNTFATAADTDRVIHAIRNY